MKKLNVTRSDAANALTFAKEKIGNEKMGF